VITRRDNDLVAALAIAAGMAVGLWFLGPVAISFGNVDRQAETNARMTEVIKSVETLGGVPFHASSFTSGFSTQGVYAGTMTYEGDHVRIWVPEASLRRLENRPDGERLVALRLGLAVGTGDGTWQVISDGAAHPIEADAIAEGENVLIRNLELTVPVIESQLCGAWLVIVHELEYLNEKGESQPAWTYAHSDRESFKQLVRKVTCPGQDI
jgi:hypothetical protein